MRLTYTGNNKLWWACRACNPTFLKSRRKQVIRLTNVEIDGQNMEVFKSEVDMRAEFKHLHANEPICMAQFASEVVVNKSNLAT